MRTTFSLLLFAFFMLMANSQQIKAQAVHDAFALYDFALEDTIVLTNENTKEEDLYAILARNHFEKLDNPTRDQLIQVYANNPFIGPSLQRNPNLGGTETYNGSSGQRAIGALAGASSGLGLPGSTFLMGLTDFLVKRTKQELTIAFFRDFQKIVKDSEEMQFLFPSTTKVLLKIDENIYQFKAFWEVLRGSFMKDLEDLVYNLEDYIQYSSRFKKPVVRHMMSDFFKVIELFYDKTPPTDVVDYLANKAYLHDIDASMDSSAFIPVLQTSLKILGLFSESLKTQDGNGYWVAPDKIRDMMRTPKIGLFYLGLLYQQSLDTKIIDKKFSEHLATFSASGSGEKVRNLLAIFKSFLDNGKTLYRLSIDMRERKNDRRRNKNAGPLTDADKELEYDEYFEFTQGICDMVMYTFEFKKELFGSSTKEDSLVRTYLSIISDINAVALNIRKTHYTSALINTLFIIEKLLPEDKFKCERQVILKYGTFIATAVQAKTAAEVSDAISAFALPPGGSAIKKYSKFSIALNAYVGLSAGQELLTDASGNALDPKAYYAVTTPIGVSFNWGFKNYGSIGILASILDIGALTAFRFEDDSAGDLPDLKFENVLAPGGYIVYGLPKYPLSIGIGAQLGPNLRSVTNGTLNTTASGWRWGAFIAVDIPIVSIYTTNKNYKQCCRKCAKKDNVDF